MAIIWLLNAGSAGFDRHGSEWPERTALKENLEDKFL